MTVIAQKRKDKNRKISTSYVKYSVIYLKIDSKWKAMMEIK